MKHSIIPYKLPILAILALAAIICGYQMWNLPLWGHRPLIFFTAIWAFFMIALADKYTKLPQKGRLLALSTLSGLLLGFGLQMVELYLTIFSVCSSFYQNYGASDW